MTATTKPQHDHARPGADQGLPRPTADLESRTVARGLDYEEVPRASRVATAEPAAGRGKGKRGQAYNLNLAGSDILAPDGRGNWHISPKCSNRAFWDRKRETNMARDRRVTHQLRGRGWKVIRIWQHSLKKSPEACLTRIRRALAAV